MSLASDEACWDRLCHHGAPLLALASCNERRTPQNLTAALKGAHRNLMRPERQAVRGRKHEALQALVLALKIHYPSFYGRLSSEHPEIAALVPNRITGRLIKLKRIAAAQLADFL